MFIGLPMSSINRIPGTSHSMIPCGIKEVRRYVLRSNYSKCNHRTLVDPKKPWIRDDKMTVIEKHLANPKSSLIWATEASKPKKSSPQHVVPTDWFGFITFACARGIWHTGNGRACVFAHVCVCVRVRVSVSKYVSQSVSQSVRLTYAVYHSNVRLVKGNNMGYKHKTS